MNEGERRSWAKKVLHKMQRRIDMERVSQVYFHAGEKYQSYFAAQLRGIGKQIRILLEGYGIGEQMHWYDEQLGRAT